jgi:hypothetical protein
MSLAAPLDRFPFMFSGHLVYRRLGLIHEVHTEVLLLSYVCSGLLRSDQDSLSALRSPLQREKLDHCRD